MTLNDWVSQMDHLLCSTAKAILELARFADRKVDDGTMTKRRFIRPSLGRVKNWVSSVFKQNETNVDYHTQDEFESGKTFVFLGSASGANIDPEYLPPSNNWERWSNKLRVIPRFFRSPSCGLGLRVACATMTISIINLLHDSQSFFDSQRLLWAQIIVAISMRSVEKVVNVAKLPLTH